MYNNKNILIISGPSGIGKTTLVHELINRYGQERKIIRIITYTTRNPRVGEHNSIDYWFISKQEFDQKQQQNFFIETASYGDHWYGTPRAELYNDDHATVVLILNRDGALRIKKLIPSAKLVWLYVKDDAIIRQRLTKRGTESEAEIEKRFACAQQEMKAEYEHHLYDFHIENVDREKALDVLEKLL